jgi:Tol biopolymer transport system component
MRLTLVSVVVLLAADVRAAGVVRQLTSEVTTVAAPASIDDAGTAVYTGASADLLGTNAAHAFQLWKFDPVTGAATQLSSDPRGFGATVSVSDDGTWLAFPSPADPLGTNHDRGIELFVMRSDGTQLAQLTNDPAPNGGSVGSVAISGNGTRVAFTSNTNPLGTNPSNRSELFVIDRTGANLRQLTATTTGSIGGISVSDDGTRIAFSHSGDLVGTNADLGGEIFAILSDGTGLRQLTTTPAPYAAGSPSLAGGGLRVAFQSDADPFLTNANHQDEIFAVDWAGTGLRQVTRTTVFLGFLGAPGSQSPSITDDGVTIVYHSNQSALFPPLNLDGNYEVFKIRFDGTSRAALTSTAFEAGSLLPVVSGSGNRIAFYAVGTNVALRVIDGSGGSGRDLVSFDLKFVGEPAIAADGSRTVFTRSTGLFGGSQVWRVEADGTGLAQVTALASGSASSPSIAADRNTIVYAADSNPTGGNADGSTEIFKVLADGSGTVQVSNGASGTTSSNPVVAANVPVVVFDSDADLTGGNADASVEVFKANLDGSGVVQLTNGIAGTTSARPRVDASGTWVVFESDVTGSYEVWRVRTDGSGLQPLTADAVTPSRSPDVDASGSRVVWQKGGQIVAWDDVTTVARALTAFATGSSGGARLSGDGTWVVFSSDAPVFESDPDAPSDLYRVPFLGGGIERIGGLRFGALGGIGGLLGGGGGAAAVDGAGIVSLFSGIGDFTLGNPDGLPELWSIDRAALPVFEVGKDAPTVLRWSVESGPVRYDAIRGNVANLRFVGSTVDLGAVTCLENDSPDVTTAGFGDPDTPQPGQVFFFVTRGSVGVDAGPGSYGTSKDGRERVAGSGGCGP